MSGRIHKLYLVTTVFYLFLSCAKPMEIIIPDDPVYPTSGSACIDSRIVDNLRSGFRFAVADTIYYPNSNQLYPDVALRVSTVSGTSLEFFAVEVRPAFKLALSLSAPDSAALYFDSLLTISDTTGFTYSGPGVDQHQIWLVRTNMNKYAKILITTDTIDIDNIGKISFNWVYQPDGSLTFPAQ